MRILVAHNRYQFSGGEDVVVHDEIEMLQHYGHSVELLEQDNDAIHGFCGKLIAATSVFYSARSRKRMKDVIHDFCPDVVHIHNWFPMLSPSIIMEADASRIPIVQTLHNYRMLCANAQLYRDGVICTDCLGKSLPLDGVIHGCYRGSRTGSAIVTAAYAFHRLVHTWDRVDLFIAVSGFEREILRSGGLPAERMAVKPNFVGSNNWEAERKIEEAALFVGRLSPGKGIRTLLSAWNTGRIPLRLKIIGDGPMADEIRSFAAGNTDVEYQGQQSLDAVYREMAKAKFLVFPSELFETFGRTVVEAYSQGTPVLVSDLGGMQELVEEGVTGFCFPPGNIDALIAGTLRFPTGEDYERMRTNCRNLFLRKFTPEINYAQLMEIYARAIAIRKTRQQTR
jgi:glycosyltransferase involved in cell wall biosynthesis